MPLIKNAVNGALYYGKIDKFIMFFLEKFHIKYNFKSRLLKTHRSYKITIINFISGNYIYFITIY
jgi:hypothetical protein